MKRGRGLLIAIFTILLIIILFIGGLIVYYGFLKDQTSQKNNDEAKEVIDTQMISSDRVISEVKYSVSKNDNWEVYDVSNELNEDTRLYRIEEGQSYKFGNEYLTLKQGVPTIVKDNTEIKSSINNVLYIYIITSDYNHQFAFLTNSGEIYVGNSLIYVSGIEYHLANEELFNRVEKVESDNVYESVKLVKILNNEAWLKDDVIEYYFLATTNNSQDLIIINYN